MKDKKSKRLAYMQPAILVEQDLAYKNGKKLSGTERTDVSDYLFGGRSWSNKNMAGFAKTEFPGFGKSSTPPFHKKGGESFIKATCNGKDEKGRTLAFIYKREGKPSSYRKLYRDFLEDTSEMIKEGGGEEVSKESRESIKNAIRKQAHKENLMKAGGVLAASGAVYGGYKAYKHYKDKKKTNKKDDK